MEYLDPEDARMIYEDIRQRVKKLYTVRREFYGHLVAYAFFMFFFWFVLVGPNEAWRAVFEQRTAPAIIAALISAGWTMGILTHFTQYIFEELEQRALRRELEAAGFAGYAHVLREKAKNSGPALRLSDDGELEEVLLLDEHDQAEAAR